MNLKLTFIFCVCNLLPFPSGSPERFPAPENDTSAASSVAGITAVSMATEFSIMFVKGM